MVRFCLVAGMTVALVLPGCGGGEKGPETVKVSGTVQMDGAPVKEGAISFLPADGKGAASGGTIKEGKFSFPSTLGSKRVEISAPRVIGKQKSYDTPDSPVVDVTEEGVAKEFNKNSTLKGEVTKSKTEFKFDVKAAPASAKKS